MTQDTTYAPTTTDPGSLRGALLPQDPGYAESVTTFLGTGTPALVHRPRTAAEVAQAVRLARRDGTSVTVRGGGHSMAGRSTAAGGLLLDLRELDEVTVEPGSHVVHLGGGATWGQVAEALAPHGLAISSGDSAGVGVGGLTLGGGVGWMVRRDGLTIDNLVGAQLVTSDGEVLEVGPDEHPDLFWALRGGGGGLGVVTRFDILARPLETVLHGTVVLAADSPRDLLATWWEAQRDADERVTTAVALMPAAGDRPAAAMLGVCVAATGPEARDLVEPLLHLGTVLSEDLAERAYADVLEEAPRPEGMQVAVDNVLLPALDEPTLDRLASTFLAGSVVALRAVGGALNRVPADATAFPGRSAQVLVTAMRMGFGRPAEHPAELADWRAVVEGSIGAYANFLSRTDPATAARVHPGATGERLARIREHRDPTRMFSA